MIRNEIALRKSFNLGRLKNFLNTPGFFGKVTV